jgi:branched-chain amino acid aminotransferase
MQEWTYMNGEILPIEKAFIHINDLGLVRGYGVFDYFRAISGKPVFLKEHLQRFKNSTHLLGLKTGLSASEIETQILKLIELNAAPMLGLKMICTGGYSPDGYTPTEPNLIITARPFVFADTQNGLKLMLVEHERELPEVKTLNYIVPITTIVRQKAMAADDVLYHKNGYVTESSRSNIFIVKDGVVITPDKGVLKGITRQNVIETAQKNFPVEVRPMSLLEVISADEVFTTGSTKRVVPITQIDNFKFAKGKITEKILSLLLEKEKE